VPASDAPILVLASGQRCGSTLIQRLLSSHPDVLIWGENGGHLGELLEASNRLQIWDDGVAKPARAVYEDDGHHSWMANLLPPAETVAHAARAYLETLFAAPAAAQGRARWGLKEVRWGREDAELIRALYPGTRVVHLTRDPRKVLVSLAAWEEQQAWWRRSMTVRALGRWKEVNESFLKDRDSEWVSSWRLEDVLAGTDRFTDEVARFLDLDPSALDRSVFDRPIHSYPGATRGPLRSFDELEPDLRGLLDDADLRELTAAYGYELDEASPPRRRRAWRRSI
jgi:Sulfotransferase family